MVSILSRVFIPTVAIANAVSSPQDPAESLEDYLDLESSELLYKTAGANKKVQASDKVADYEYFIPNEPSFDNGEYGKFQFGTKFLADVFMSYAIPVYSTTKVDNNWVIFNPEVSFEGSVVNKSTFYVGPVEFTVKTEFMGGKITPLSLLFAWDLD